MKSPCKKSGLVYGKRNARLPGGDSAIPFERAVPCEFIARDHCAKPAARSPVEREQTNRTPLTGRPKRFQEASEMAKKAKENRLTALLTSALPDQGTSASRNETPR
jgi:hypothetical protein